MSNNSVVLYFDSNNPKNSVTFEDYKKFVDDKNKNAIADFIYKRLYSRYIKPFEFDDATYKKEYKNGFSMMASFCLLIETLQSFRKGLGDSNGQSTDLFKDFFQKIKIF